MNTQAKLVCLIAALIVAFLFQSAHADNSAFDVEIKPLQTTKFCRRKIDIDRSNDGVKFKTVSGCASDRKNGTLIGTFSEMDFFAHIGRFPIIGMKAKTVVKVATKNLAKDFTVVVGSSFGIDKIIEYTEVNNVEGFQPANDTVSKIYNLRDFPFKVIELSKVLAPGSNDTYVYKAVAEANVTGCCTMRVSAVISSATVQYTSPKFAQRTGITQVLSPTSLKVSFELANINYSKQNTLLAVSTLLAFRGTRRDKTKSENDNLPPPPNRASGSYEKPDDASDDQTVHNFDNDVSTQLDGNQATLPRPFFSFQNFISKFPTSSPATVTRGKLVISSFSNTDKDETESKLIKDVSVDSNSAVVRFWVSLTERVENFVWDPATGSSDDSNNVATTSAASKNMIGLLVALLVAVFAVVF